MDFKEKSISRKRFIKKALLAVLTIEVFWLLGRFFGFHKGKKRTDKLFDAGSIQSFEKGKFYFYRSQGFCLYCLDDGGFLAMDLKCTHLGCKVNFDRESQRFICPCHSSAFNAMGEVLSSPAYRPLDLYVVMLEDNRLKVDLSKAVKRSDFNIKQIFYHS